MVSLLAFVGAAEPFCEASFAQFEELSFNKRMEEVAKNEEATEEDDIDVELRLSRFEYLMERRLLLLNSVLLRQNPHNVHEWHKRVNLYEDKPTEIINTYTEAVQTVQPKLAVGNLHTLWVGFAKFYESNGQVEDARVVFERGTEVEYVKVADLLRQQQFEAALKLMQRATAMPKRKVAYHDDSETVQSRLHRSLKVWSMYADLEESFGTFKTCKAVYESIIDLKICTPQVIINYGMFLEEHNYFEDAYRAYEKGIALFKWPNVYDIWNSYLSKFLARYGGTKLERARDLFEHLPALREAGGGARPGPACHVLLRSRHVRRQGREDVRHVQHIREEGRRDLRPATHQGDLREGHRGSTRAAYAPHVRQIRRAGDEAGLGGSSQGHLRSQVCDPRITADFWHTWKEFEVRHGNEDTMREMLRIKTYNTQVNMMAAQFVNTNTNGVAADAGAGSGPDAMRLLEEKARQAAADAKQKPAEKAASNIMFVRGETQGGAKGKENTVFNPDEIDIGDSEDDYDDEEEDPQQPSGDQAEAGQATTKTDDEGLIMKKLRLEQKAIPAKVFGSLKPTNQSDSDEG
ncbi:pre-mRNA-splicing factor syf1 homolog [Drosophila miranda]|uniref:pre-mRNA-splicing factor syf1 homolog n=1 Tax=Drosophila miranda TaxID=7229 RepID=UPI00143F7B5D|nr:pre-mRNA-splicing factor syf1 homolog [Drosophila miranda]